MTALNVFRHVAELGSFAEAARRLRLSPPAISKHVAELEARLGVRLINRTTRRLHLTEAGTAYLESVRRILDELEEADRALGPLTTDPIGTLKVTAPASVTLMRLSARLPEFLASYPEVSLDLHLDDRRVDLLRDGYDLGLRGSDNLEDSSLIARRLTTLHHVLVAAPSYWAARGRPTHPGELVGHECVRFTLSGHADLWEFRRNGRVERVPVRGRYSVASSLSVRDALLAGFGASLVPRIYVETDLGSGRLEAVLEDWDMVETVLYAVYPSRRHLAPKLRVFLDFLADVFRDGDGRE